MNCPKKETYVDSEFLFELAFLAWQLHVNMTIHDLAVGGAETKEIGINFQVINAVTLSSVARGSTPNGTRLIGW